MRHFITLLVTLTICGASSLAVSAQVPDRVHDLIQQARSLAKSAEDSARDAAAHQSEPLQNPFSRDNTARTGVGIQGAAYGARSSIDLSDSAIRITVGAQSITIPRRGADPVLSNPALTNPAHPSEGIGHNHLANHSNAVGGVTINGHPVGGCLLRNGVAIIESGDVRIGGYGSNVSTAAYRELAAGMEAFGRSDFAAAVGHLKKSVEANPTGVLPHPFLSLALFANADFDAAAEYAYSAAATSSVWDWNQLRSYYADPVQYVQGYELLQLAARQPTAKPGTHFLLAWHHLMLGHRVAAQAELERVLQHLPNDPVALGLLELARQPIIAPPEPMK